MVILSTLLIGLVAFSRAVQAQNGASDVRYWANVAMAAYSGGTGCNTGGNRVLGEFGTRPGISDGGSGFFAEIPARRAIVIAFKGSGTSELPVNAGIGVNPGWSACPSCRVMSGPLEHYQGARDNSNRFKVAYDAVARTGYSLVITGHSLGGAMCTIAAAELPGVNQAFCYGTYRLLNQAAVTYIQNKLGQNLHRGTYGQDAAVALYPSLTTGFYHYGRAWLMTALTTTECSSGESALCGGGLLWSDHFLYGSSGCRERRNVGRFNLEGRKAIEGGETQ